MPAPVIGVIGTGAWGSVVACLAAQRATVRLWGRRAELTTTLAQTRRHPQVPGLVLPPAVQPTANASELADCQVLLWAVPTQHSRATATELAALLPRVPVISLSKGLELDTRQRVSGILTEILPGRPLAALSGPGLAPELAQGRPTGLVAAGDAEACRQLVALLHGGSLRIYTSPDLPGVELAGALKNVIAIAAGACDGLGLGDNAKATLVTRGIAELRRLGRALGCREATFAGLAGIGDLMATCYSSHSRNRALGESLARGVAPATALAGSRVAEGAWTCRAAVALAGEAGVELPIALQVAEVIWHATPVPSAIEVLFARAAKEEEA
jgi:glycerol-3-phosphate dehydrogenase (NAD(P)+)